MAVEVQASAQSDILARLKAVDGQVFSVPGPNCFATALKLSGITRSFRGMDEPEFRQIVKLSCKKVDVPQIGDIGVFEKPGFGFIHAYVYVSEEMGMQKPGVDYAGQTPIAFVPLSGISYTYLASPECRRYSRDISECANENYYLRCEKLVLPQDAWTQNHEAVIAGLERDLDSLLLSRELNAASFEVVARLSDEMSLIRRDVEGRVLAPDLKQLLLSRVISIEKQIKFFATNMPK